jgi:hypothetical protein
VKVVRVLHMPGEHFDRLVATATAALEILVDESAGIDDREVAASEMIATVKALTFADMPETIEREEAVS